MTQDVLIEEIISSFWENIYFELFSFSVKRAARRECDILLTFQYVQGLDNEITRAPLLGLAKHFPLVTCVYILASFTRVISFFFSFFIKFQIQSQSFEQIDSSNPPCLSLFLTVMFISDFPEILWSRNRDLKTTCLVIISCLNLQLHVNLAIKSPFW